MPNRPTSRRSTAGCKAAPSRKAGRESLDARRRRAAAILAELHTLYADAECALVHKSAFELLVATILSAQSTDETVNKVTPELFARYPTPAALAAADRADVERLVHSTGFFRNKAKNIQGAATTIAEHFGGEVPQTMDELLTLPGVARKTANVVLGTWFERNEGVVVDTHVGRLATRLKLTQTGKDSKDAVRIEKDLMEVIPRDDWTFLSHALIWHGRKVCRARKPACTQCVLAPLCPSAGLVDDAGEKPLAGSRKSAAAKRPAARPRVRRSS
jgi:endonuclease-3